ncbi:MULTISPECIES: hypothetical protein [unclassified Bradyrhizobium]
MSTAADMAYQAARQTYAAEGHVGGLLHLTPVSGRAASNVVDMAAARSRRQAQERSDD